MSASDEKEYTLNRRFHFGVQEQQFLKAPSENLNAALKICFHSTELLIRWRQAGNGSNSGRIQGRCRQIEIGVCLIGKNPVHRDEGKMGEDLLLDAALGLGMKIFDDEDTLAHFIKFFDPPPGVVEVDKILFRVAILV